MNYKRVTAAVFATALLISPIVASADTLSDLQAKIDALLSQLAGLQAQMQQLQSTSPSVSTAGTNSGASTATTGSAPIQCPLIARTIALGASGSDVSQLQRFLAQQGVFSGDVTGYFGSVTQAAVQAWQSQQGLVSSGDPSATGWGVFGPRSQNWLARICSGTTPTPTQNGSFGASVTSGSAPLVVRFTVTVPSSHSDTYMIAYGDGTNETVYNTLACGRTSSGTSDCPDVRGASHTYKTAGTYTAILYRQAANAGACYGAGPCGTQIASTVITVSATPTACMVVDCAPGYHVTGPSCSTQQSCVPDSTTPVKPTTSLTPVVSGVDGPASMAPGQTGTWTVHASVASSADQNLRYSVIWGDESVLDRLTAFAAGQSAVVTSGTFTHTYTNAGTYSPLFTVSNSAGSSQAGASVKVAFAGTPINCPVYMMQACPAGYTNGTGSINSNGCYQPGPCVPAAGGKLTATPSSGAAPLSVLFQTYTTATSIDFGDGSSQQINPLSITTCSTAGGGSGSATCPTFFVNHTYSSAGTYTAKLRSDGGPTSGACYGVDCNVIGTATITVTSGTSAAAALTATPASGSAPLSVHFTGKILGTSLIMDYGDGSQPELSNTIIDCAQASPNCGQGYVSSVDRTHVYTQQGTYTAKISSGSNSASATVTVGGGTSDGGVTASVVPGSTKVTISAPMAAQKMQQCVYSIGFFGASGNGLSVDWGDGSTSPANSESSQGLSCTSDVTSHVYAGSGTYTITVTSWHPGPTDFPITDWKGSTSVTISGTGPTICPAIAYQTPICPAGQRVASRYTSSGCPAPSVCVPIPTACTAIGFVIPTCPAGQHVEQQYGDNGCQTAPICANGATSIFSQSNTSQAANALSALQAALERLIGGLVH